MKQTAQPDTTHQQKAIAAGRSRRAEQTVDTSGNGLAQLAAMVNGSRPVQGIAQGKAAIQQSPAVQNLMSLSNEINQSIPGNGAAQLQLRTFGTLAQGDRADDHLATESDSQSSGQSCDCGAKQDKSSASERRVLTEKSPMQRKSLYSRIPIQDAESPARNRPTFSSEEVIQKKEQTGQVTGLTHLVKKQGKSIFRGQEEHEVNAPDQITVETSDRIRSRRGPNQEEFSDYDEISEKLYRWFGVRFAPGIERDEDWYIREDAFEFVEGLAPRVSMNLEERGERRTRQSHHLVRFEVWHNSDDKIDPTGHMMVYEFRSKQYREYAQARDKGEITGRTLKFEEGGESQALFAQQMKAEFLKLGVINASTGKEFDKAPEPFRLAVLEMNEQDALERRSGEKRKKEQAQVPRFNLMSWADVMFTVEETIKLDERREKRKEFGVYYFVKEIQTIYPDATRCLSWLEDAAQGQMIQLVEGHAKKVLDDYIKKRDIKPAHTGTEDV